MKKELFGQTTCGQDIYLYTLENKNGMQAVVMNYGANLVKLLVPDHAGEVKDIVMGFDKLEDYYVNGSFFGAVIGPSANRIGGGQFTLEGVTYDLLKNDGGANNLHSDPQKGVHKRVWDVEEGENCVKFSIRLADMDMGFPGNKELSVTYSLNDENELKLEYAGTSDKNTLINMTNHTYFNLNGHDAGTNGGHVLTIKADNFTWADAASIPTGEILPVAGTPMDFTSPRVIGKSIDDDYEQLNWAGGYDHNWCLNDYTGEVRLVAEATNETGSRIMQVCTDLPGVQFYAGNFIAPVAGKGGCTYDKRGAFCLETQYYPDSINKPEFPSCVFGPEKPYHTVTVFKFI